MNAKEPWLAVILSSFFPGVGQLYTGETFKGNLLIFIQITCIVWGLLLIFIPQGKVGIGAFFILAK